MKICKNRMPVCIRRSCKSNKPPRQHSNLKVGIPCRVILVLTGVLTVAVLFCAAAESKKSNEANDKLNQANDKLNQDNAKLNQDNAKLKEGSDKLKEGNDTLKEGNVAMKADLKTLAQLVAKYN